MEEWDDDGTQPLAISEASQLCESAIALAASIDVCRDRESRKQLMLALKSIVWRLNPPKGEIYEFQRKAN